MATSNQEEQIGGGISWLTGGVVGVIAGGLLWGFVITVSSAPALLITPHYLPGVAPFLWTAIAGLTLAFIGMQLAEEDIALVSEFLEEYTGWNKRARIIFMATIYTIVIGAITAQITIVGAGAFWIASQGYALPAVLLALWYPRVDIWLSRNIGINVAAIGAVIVLLFMGIVAVLSDVSPSVPLEAGRRVKGMTSR